MFTSKNMNYIYNKEYFNGLSRDINSSGEQKKYIIPDIKQRNDGLFDFKFPIAWDNSLSDADGFVSFNLTTSYPGLLIGTGNPHNLNGEGVIKCGFTFDYVTGLPYLPGSSLKGVLRSVFPGQHKEETQKEECRAYIKGFIGEDVDVDALEKEIFDNNDVFLYAYPVIQIDNKGGNNLLASEFITPHKGWKNPIPINMIKIKPGAKIKFCFLLKDGILLKDKKLDLFKNIILDMGVGAKTNVGFGVFSDTEGKCKICGKKTGRNKNTGEFYEICNACQNR